MHRLRELTNHVITLMNYMRTKDNFSFARKSMVICGLFKDVNGMWNTGQITQQLQDIITEHQEEVDCTFLLETNIM